MPEQPRFSVGLCSEKITVAKLIANQQAGVGRYLGESGGHEAVVQFLAVRERHIERLAAVLVAMDEKHHLGALVRRPRFWKEAHEVLLETVLNGGPVADGAGSKCPLRPRWHSSLLVLCKNVA